MRNDRASAQATIWAEGGLPPQAAATQGSASLPKAPAAFQPLNRPQRVWRAVDVEPLLEPDPLAWAAYPWLSGGAAVNHHTPSDFRRARAARAKVERLQPAREELQKVQGAPAGRADPAPRRGSETDTERQVTE